MSFIDWSDPEGLFDLLVEFVADETKGCHGDVTRRQFLTHLLTDLNTAKEQFPTITVAEAVIQLQSIHDSIDQEFLDDPVIVHITACIEELERIRNGAA